MGKIRLFSVIFLIINIAFSQISLNINPTKRIIVEKFSNSNKEYKSDYLLFQKTPFQLGINQYFIYNTNHPNLENHNGIYTPKGLSQMTSLLIHYSGKNIIASLEPSLKTSQEFKTLKLIAIFTAALLLVSKMLPKVSLLQFYFGRPNIS